MTYEARENKIYDSLNQPKLLFGISERIAVPLWLITIGGALVMHVWLLIPIALVIHYFCRWLFKQDPDRVEVFEMYRKQGDVYDPWPRANTEAKRPDGFGRDLLC